MRNESNNYYLVRLSTFKKMKKTSGDEDARERDTTNSRALPLTQVWEIK